MSPFYNSHLTLWPATPLPASVEAELAHLGVDVAAMQMTKGTLAAYRTPEQALLLELSFEDRRYGLSDLEAVLATLRLADISYVAWDLEDGAAAGNGCSYNAPFRHEKKFTVTAAGEPVLSYGDLEAFDVSYDTAEDLFDALQASLCLSTPTHLTEASAADVAIEIAPDNDEPDEQIAAVDEPPCA